MVMSIHSISYTISSFQSFGYSSRFSHPRNRWDSHPPQFKTSNFKFTQKLSISSSIVRSISPSSMGDFLFRNIINPFLAKLYSNLSLILYIFCVELIIVKGFYIVWLRLYCIFQTIRGRLIICGSWWEWFADRWTWCSWPLSCSTMDWGIFIAFAYI